MRIPQWVAGRAKKQLQIPRSAYPTCVGPQACSARDDKTLGGGTRLIVGGPERKRQLQIPRSAYPTCVGPQACSARDDKTFGRGKILLGMT